MKELHDGKEIYCRSLGHYVGFGYCRAAGGDLPCPRIAECWAGRVPIEEYLRGNYPQQVLERIFAPRPGKLETILDIVENLKRNPPQSPPCT